MTAAIVITAAGASLLFNIALVSLLHRLAVLDVPNARSLHAQPTPRGGGIAIALVFSLALVLIPIGSDSLIPWLAAGAGFAALGAWDDWRPRHTVTRLALQFALIATFLATTWSMPVTVASAIALCVVGAAMIWMVNLFNFMDGADGFAATQTILFAVAAAWVFKEHGRDHLALASIVLAATTVGFLPCNWHPARMFMGDAGSYFLGFQFAVFIYLGWWSDVPVAALLILPAPFIVDATLTLIRRMCRGERWWSAHRTHAYQRLVLHGWSPRCLVLALVIISCGWCWPAAWCAIRQPQHEWLICLGVYGVLGGVWYHIVQRFRAGH